MGSHHEHGDDQQQQQTLYRTMGFSMVRVENESRTKEEDFLSPTLLLHVNRLVCIKVKAFKVV